MLLLAAAALLFGELSSRPGGCILIGGAALIFAAFVGSYVVHFARMALPLLPVLAFWPHGGARR